MTDRPQTWTEYIGQHKATQLLRMTAEASRRRHSPFPHTLLSGPPGVGKTSLAELVAREMKQPIVLVQGGKLEVAADLSGLSSRLKKGNFLFIDEVHAAKRAVLELLYEIMEPGNTRSFFALRFPQITVIAATTNPGQLPRPFLDRCQIKLTLDPYTDVEIADLLELRCKQASAEAVILLARAAQGIPRVALNYLQVAQDIATVTDSPDVTEDIAAVALDSLEVTPEGWTKSQVQYLTILAYTHNGGPASADTLAVSLGTDRPTLSSMIEGPLISHGLVSITGRGRKLTPIGDTFVRVQLLPAII